MADYFNQLLVKVKAYINLSPQYWLPFRSLLARLYTLSALYMLAYYKYVVAFRA